MSSTITYLGKRILGNEGFTETDKTVTVNTDKVKEAAVGAIGMIAFVSFLTFVFAIASCVGSARLSYCYNIAVGNPSDVAFLFAVLCFFFAPFYYPYYAFFLNPVCAIRNRGIFGGRR